MKTAALFLSLIAFSPAWAESKGGDLLSACVSTAGTQGDMICNSYVKGLTSGIFLDQVAREGGKPVCLPEEVSTDQVREVIAKFFVNHPEVTKLPLAAGVTAAIMTAYPCQAR